MQAVSTVSRSKCTCQHPRRLQARLVAIVYNFSFCCVYCWSLQMTPDTTHVLVFQDVSDGTCLLKQINKLLRLNRSLPTFFVSQHSSTCFHPDQIQQIEECSDVKLLVQRTTPLSLHFFLHFCLVQRVKFKHWRTFCIRWIFQCTFHCAFVLWA